MINNRKAGGQPRHDGKALEMADSPDKIVEHRACFCPECGNDLSSQPFEYYRKSHPKCQDQAKNIRRVQNIECC